LSISIVIHPEQRLVAQCKLRINVLRIASPLRYNYGFVITGFKTLDTSV